MALVEPSVMTNAIMGKLYDVLTNGDDTVPKSEADFFSWCTPGIPFMEGDFDFLTQGLTGVVKKADLDEMRSATAPPAPAAGDGTAPAGSGPELTPALLDQLRAADASRLYQQAETFARLVDFIPAVPARNEASASSKHFERLAVMNNHGSLSECWETILRMSQVMHADLPPDTKKKIDKFRGMLTVTKTKKNLIDDSEVEVTEQSPLVQAYNEKLAAYEAAALDYNMKRIDALAATTPQAVHSWAMNASILRNRVKAAMADWVSAGYKNDYEQIAAFLDQVMQRDMALLKQQYRDDLAKARLTGLASGSDFYFTSLAPGNFAKAPGWTTFGFTSSDYSHFRNTTTSFSSTSGSGAASFLGVFTLGVAGAHAEASANSASTMRFESEQFGLSFSIAQVPIVRPWFKTSFFTGKTWRFDQSNPEAKSWMVSDGAKQPAGLMPAYPTSLVCIKNLTLRFAKSTGLTQLRSELEHSTSTGTGCIGFGPFVLGGAGAVTKSKGSSRFAAQFSADGQTMTVPGLQVIGFKCHLVPKSPDPLASIKSWI